MCNRGSFRKEFTISGDLLARGRIFRTSSGMCLLILMEKDCVHVWACAAQRARTVTISFFQEKAGIHQESDDI